MTKIEKAKFVISQARKANLAITKNAQGNLLVSNPNKNITVCIFNDGNMGIYTSPKLPVVHEDYNGALAFLGLKH